MNIIKLNAIPSTNTFLLEANKKQELPDLTIVVAKAQTKGRGQSQNHWKSVTGKSLTFSLLKKFNNLPASKSSLLLFAIALAVREALSEIMSFACQIKWPNDIMSEKNKISGILIENQIKNNLLNSAIIGIGVNVNNNSFKNLPQASSMLLLTNKTYVLDEVLLTIFKKIIFYLEYVTNDKEDKLIKMYENHLFKKDKISVFKSVKEKIFNGIIRGVTNQGQLKLELDSGEIKVFNTKEITMMF